MGTFTIQEDEFCEMNIKKKIYVQHLEFCICTFASDDAAKKYTLKEFIKIIHFGMKNVYLRQANYLELAASMSST